MIKKEDIEEFVIICKKCKLAGRSSETMLHLDWDRRIYAILCSNASCNVSEVFDEDCNKIELPESVKEIEKKERSVN